MDHVRLGHDAPDRTLRASFDVVSEGLYLKPTKALADKRRELAPDIAAAFQAFSEVVFQEGALSRKTMQLVAVAVAQVMQCPYCIQWRTKTVARAGATPEEIMEAIWVAAEMRAGGAYAHSILALTEIEGVHHGGA